MKKKIALLMITLATSGLNLACQNVASNSLNNNKTPSQAVANKSPREATENFLSALRDNDYEKIKLSTCLQKSDLTKYAPIGVKDWKIQEVSEESNEFEPSEKYSLAVVDVEAIDSAASWKLRVWNSDEFFASRRRFTKELNERTSKANAALANTNLQPMEVEELPSRVDISSAPYCIERIAQATEKQP
jgi:hypothetical protein